MGQESHRSNHTRVGWRAIAMAAATIGLVTAVTGGTSVLAAPPVPPPPPADVTVECAALVPDPVDLTAVDPEDGDIEVSPVDDITPGDSTHEFVIERTWTFIDTDEETSSVSQTITVADTTAPVFNAVPPDVTVGGVAAIPVAARLDATDNCEGALQSEVPLDGIVGTGDNQVITRTWKVADKAGNENTATQTITVVPPVADLEITVTTSANPVTAGVSLTYTITVKNLGPHTATGVQVTTLPIAGATTLGCTNVPVDAALCTLGSLANGATKAFTATVLVPANATDDLVRTWAVSSLAADPEPANDTFATDVDVIGVAAMTVTASVVVTERAGATTAPEGPATALAAGDPVEITITVGNDGPSDATDATVQAMFTTNIDNLVVVDDGLYGCQINDRILSCTLASHPAGTTVVIRLSGALTGSSTEIFQGPVTVDSAHSDPTATTSIILTVIRSETTTTTITEDTTTTAAPAATTTPPASGAIPTTGSDSNNVIRVSFIALLIGLAAVIVARRRPDLIPAVLTPRARTELPERRIVSNGVSTVIEEPRRDPHQH